MKSIYSIILIVFFVQPLKGQELYGKYLGQEQGLLSDECYDISYDKKGYLIVGTEYGPMKYNGEKFIPICTNLSMERRIIYDFEKDPQGTVYLLNSKNELFKLENDKAIWIGPKNRAEFHIQNFTFLKLYSTKDALYICDQHAYLKFSFKTKKISRPYTYKDDAPFAFIYNSKKTFPFIKYTGSNVTTNHVVFKFPESNQFMRFENAIAYDSREDHIRVGETTYLLMCMGLFKKTENKVTRLNFNHILFIEYFHNRIWLCTLEGLMELDSEGKLIHHHFKGEAIGGVTPLKSGGIAVSLNRKGIFVSANINNRIHSNITPGAATRFRGINLVGTSKGEVFKFTGSKLKKLLDAPKKIAFPYTNRSFFEGIYNFATHQNNLVINFHKGLVILSPDFKPIKDYRNHHYSNFDLFLSKETICFICRNSILKLDWKRLSTLPYPPNFTTIKLKNVRCGVPLNDSTFLFGTRNGLFKLNLNTDHFSRFDFFKKELSITGIHKIGQDRLLIFTQFDGIYIAYKNKLVRKITPPCISISSSLFYNQLLIVRGNDGIYIKPLNDPRNTVWFKFFSGEADNLFILDNSLLIAFKNDLIIKRLSDYQFVFKPEILLNKFRLGNREMNTLPHSIPSNNPISLDIDILQFDATKLDLYYILKGENTISQQIEGTKINFDALKSGEYELKVHPVIDGKIQFNNSKTFRFIIEETFWESTVFYITSIVLIISILFSILLIINLRRRKRRAERAELESKLNEYKLLAVKAQVNPHFLSNGLAAIQALILKGDNDLAAQYLAKFSFLMRKILYYSETQFISVKQELELADAYLELELLRFRNRFRIRKEINLSENQLINFQFPSLLLQPILENAIWHGLKFQENNPELRILFHLNQNQELIVQISDNGPGFNNSNQSEEHLSKGNQLITERIDTLNQQFQKQVASIEIFSSKSGTTVTFTFSPLFYQRKQHEGISN